MTARILLLAGLVAVCAGCSSKTKTNADIEQRDLFDPSNRRSFEQSVESVEAGGGQNEGDLKAQQDELQREFEREEQRLLEERSKIDKENAAIQAEQEYGTTIPVVPKIESPPTIPSRGFQVFLASSWPLSTESVTSTCPGAPRFSATA